MTSCDLHHLFKDPLLPRGTRLAQAREHMTLDLGVVSLSPTVGMEPRSKNKKNKMSLHQMIQYCKRS